MAVGGDAPGNKRPNTYKEHVRDGGLLLESLWKRHQSFRGLFLRETPGGSWYPLLFDPLTRAGTDIRLPEGQRFDLILPAEREMVETASFLATRRAWDANNISVFTLFPVTNHYQSTSLQEFGLAGYLTGHVFAMMHELAERLNFHWLSPNHLLEQQKKYARSIHETLHQYYAWQSLMTTKEICLGKLDVQIGSLERTGQPLPLDLLAGSFELHETKVAVPRAPALPPWTRLFYEFGCDVWGCLAASALAYALAWRAVAGEPLGASVAAALRAFSSCGGSPQDRVRATPQRLQLAGALLASAVVVSAVYQGRLYTLMTHPAHYPEIDTLEQLAESGLPIIISFSELDVSSYTETEMKENMLKKIDRQKSKYMWNSVNEVFTSLKKNQKFACTINHQYWKNFCQGSWQWKNMRVMRGYAESVGRIRHTRLNWPWNDAANVVLLRMQAAGLSAVWTSNFARAAAGLKRVLRERESNSSRQGKGSHKGAQGDRLRPFGLEDERPHMQLWGAGLALATLAFAAELLHDRVRRRRQRRLVVRRRGKPLRGAQLQRGTR